MPRPGAGATTTSSATLPTKLLSLLLLLLALLLPAAVGLAVVSSVVVSGLPVGSPASFALLGTDLAQPGGVQCSYAAASGMFLAAGTVNSATGAECNVPSAAGAGSYTLTLLYGNVAASNYFEPVVVVLYGPSAFSLVGLYPAGGPAGGGTTVTLTGAGFADFGAGQLCCSFAGAHCSSAATLLAVDEADPTTTRLSCVLPSGAAGSSTAVEITLNGAVPSAPLSSSGLQFAHYAAPTVTSFTPDSGDASGGFVITLTGSGFDGLMLLLGGGATEHVRLKIGESIGTVAPSFLSATVAIFTAPDGAAGAPSIVAIALNGQDFEAASDGGGGVPTFSFTGYHPPKLTSAAFSNDLGTLVLSFDAQPTDRASMAGVASCARLLSADSVAALVGASNINDTKVGCYWASATSLVAQLGHGTTLRAGSSVSLLPGRIFPAGCAAIGCAGLGASGTVRISRDQPCVSACVIPMALLNGPVELSSCAGQALRLDTSESTGGGATRLQRDWRVHRGESDGGNALVAVVGGVDSSSFFLDLAGVDLAGGRRWVFLLRVTNFLGASSAVFEWTVERALGQIPTLVIDGPFKLEVPPSNSLLLQGRGAPAACWPAGGGGLQKIDYHWTHEQTESAFGVSLSALEKAGALLSLVQPDRSTLQLAAFSLRPEYVYTLKLVATMSRDPSLSATARVRLSIRAQDVQPVLAGGDKRVSASRPLVVDASQSFDPNVPAAVGSGDSLSYAWTITLIRDASGQIPAGGPALQSFAPAIDVSSSKLSLPPGTLGVGFYDVAVSVIQPLAPGRAAATRSVEVEVIDEITASVSIKALPAIKFNSEWETNTERFTLDARLDGPLAAESGWTYRWNAFELVSGSPVAAPIDLVSRSVSTTGPFGRNLALVSGALTGGTTYRFELFAASSRAPQPAFAAVQIEMNRAPYGGQLKVTPTTGTATFTQFTLEGGGWLDEASDLPLEYAWFYAYASAPELSAPLSDRLRADTMTAFFPAGSLSVSVAVYDSFGARTTVSQAVTVSEPDPLTEAQIAAILDLSDEKVDMGDAAAGVQLLLAFAGLSANSSDTTARRSRRLQFGGPNDDNGGGDGGVRSSATVTRMLATLERSAAAVVSTRTFRKQLAAALVTVLRTPDALDGAAQVLATKLLYNLAVGNAGTGSDATSSAALLGCLDSVLSANSSLVEPASALLAMNLRVRDATLALASSLLAGQIAGEDGSLQESTFLNISTSRADTSSVANKTLTGLGGTGAIGVPSDAFGQTSDSNGELDDGVDTVIFTLARNVFSDPSLQPASSSGLAGADNATLGPLVSSLLSVTLKSASLGTELLISNLTEPFTFEITLSTSTDAVYGSTDDCAEFSQCSGHGSCESNKACVCLAPYYGSSCSLRARCFFYNETSETYETDGCTTLEMPDGGDSSTLYCACTHLTSFAGIEVPTSAEELQADVEGVTLNTFSASDLKDTITSGPNLAAEVAFNPLMYALVFSAVGGCALTLLVCCYKDWQGAKLRAHQRRDSAEGHAADKATAAPGAGPAVGRVASVHTQPARSGAKGADLAERVEKRLDTFDTAVAASLTGAASIIQKHARGGRGRKYAAGLVRTASERHKRVAEGGKLRTHAATRLLGMLKERLEHEHSVLGIYFSDPADMRRAELGQIFWNTLMLGLVLECMFYSSGEAPNEDAGFELVQINLVQAIITSLIVGGLLTPALVLYKWLFAWGYGRMESVGRIGAVLLGKEGPLGATVRRTRQRRLLDGAPAGEDGSPRKGSGGAAVTPEASEGRAGAIGGGAGASSKKSSKFASTQVRLAEGVRRLSGSGVKYAGYALETIAHRLDDETVEALRAKFTRYDADQSGSISTTELRTLTRDLGFRFSRGGLRRLAEKLDRSGEGRISFGEFVMWFDLQVQDAFEREERGAHGWRKVLARLSAAFTLRLAKLGIRTADAKFCAAWSIMFAIFAVLGVLAITYSRVFGPNQTQLMVLSWGLAEGQALMLEEPLVIAVAVMLPSLIGCLFGNDVSGELATNLCASTGLGRCIAALSDC